MKQVRLVLIVVCAALLINWVMADRQPQHIARVFPFLSGERPALYQAAGVAMIAIFIWGLTRLERRRRRLEQDESRFAGHSRDQRSRWNGDEADL